MPSHQGRGWTLLRRRRCWVLRLQTRRRGLLQSHRRCIEIMFRPLAQANRSMICLGQPTPEHSLVNVILLSRCSIRGTLGGVAIFTHCKGLLCPVLSCIQSRVPWLLPPVSVCDIHRSILRKQQISFWHSTKVSCYPPFAAALV